MAKNRTIGGKSRDGFTEYNDYLETAPVSGSDNQSVTWNTLEERTGRSSREVKVTYTTGQNNVYLIVRQSGKPLFVNLEAPVDKYVLGPQTATTSSAVNNDGETITFRGKTNAKLINYLTDEGPADEPFDMSYGSLSTTYTANGTTATKNQVIFGDPGNEEEFDFAITLVVEDNTSANPTHGCFSIHAYGDNGDEIILHIYLNQTGDAPYLYIDKSGTTNGLITLSYEQGDTKSIDILSNTNWQLLMNG